MHSSQGVDIKNQYPANELKSQNQLKDLKDSAQELGKSKEDKQGLKKACNKFETLFIKKLWKKMRDTLPEDGMFNSRTKEKYMSMFDQEFAAKMSEQGGIGLSKFLYDQLQTGLETASNSTFSGNATTDKDRENIAEAGKLQKETGTGDVPDSGSDFKAENVSSEQVVSESATSRNTEQITPDQRIEDLAREIVKRNGPVNREREINRDSPPVQEKDVNPGSRDNYFSASSTGLPEIKMPLDSEISSDFGWRDDPITGERAWHAGVDFAASSGEPVQACWPGEVSFAGEKEDYGKTVIVDHSNGWQSIYAHNSDNQVKKGDKVNQGEAIAKVGDSGRSTGPHLHFELRQGTQAWDPKQIRERLLAGLSIGKKV
ncbi:MAG: peptidoglycan DD-metalloendopeptidase family protein [Thermodesulfobacteriota bacterium]